MPSVQDHYKLWDIVERFVDKHNINYAEDIYDDDSIGTDSYELIEELCNTVGYKKTFNHD